MAAFVKSSHSRQRTSGFTLVEMVTVILILGVLGVGVSSFLIFGTRIFVESTSVERVLSQSRFAIERMTREIRNAVPNSLRTRRSGNDWQCLEFVPIEASASYISMPVKPDVKAKTGEVFIPSQGLTVDHMLLIYPLTPADIYTDPDPKSKEGKLFSLKKLVKTDDHYTLTFKNKIRFKEDSPRKRFFAVSGPVSYCFFGNGDIRRYTGYGINHPSQPAPKSNSMEEGVLMAQGMTNVIGLDQPVKVSPATLVNNAMVQLQPQFEVNGETFRYQHQVQVSNVP